MAELGARVDQALGTGVPEWGVDESLRRLEALSDEDVRKLLEDA